MRLPKKGPALDELTSQPQTVAALGQSLDPSITGLVDQANNEGWNWEECGYHLPPTAGINARQFWLLVKLSRRQGQTTVPLRAVEGHPYYFRYNIPSAAARILHLIDKNLGGMVQASFPQLDSPQDRERYLIASLQEEAIASSQIEGAAVTREAAKDMLLSGRKPRNPDEQMILNNYQTIRLLGELRQQPMTTALLLDIQRQLTENTLERSDAIGRLRRPDEKVLVWDEEDHQPLHLPPPAQELPARLEALCKYANESSASSSPFVHPAVRAIVLHFWLAYDHPFVDGNGRTARALFYWSMLRSGYWLIEYLSISSIIRNHPKQYARAFLNAELDEHDLTYFLLYHLRVIERSIDAMHAYLDQKLKEREQISQVLLPAQFNARQRAILTKALKEPQAIFSYQSHAHAHGATLATARSDLLALEKKGLLRGNRVGRRFEFVAVPELEKKLAALIKKKR
jgi:Fic family protein